MWTKIFRNKSNFGNSIALQNCAIQKWLNSDSSQDLCFLFACLARLKGDVDTYPRWTPPPFTLDAFSVELTQPLQIVAFSQRLVVAGCSFFSCGSRPGGSGWRHADRDKHWVQLLFDSSSSLPGVFFSLVDLGPGAAVGGMQIEINTGYICYLTTVIVAGSGTVGSGWRHADRDKHGYSCYLICNNSWHEMALQPIIELNSYSSFSNILVFVLPCNCHCNCLSYLYYDFHDILPKLRHCLTHDL